MYVKPMGSVGAVITAVVYPPVSARRDAPEAACFSVFTLSVSESACYNVRMKLLEANLQ